MALSVVKSCTKLGLSGGAIYWTYQQGVWGDPQEGADAMKRLINVMMPQDQGPASSSSYRSPAPQKMTPQSKEGMLSSGWNRGNKAVFEYVRDVPHLASRATGSVNSFIQDTFKS